MPLEPQLAIQTNTDETIYRRQDGLHWLPVVSSIAKTSKLLNRAHAACIAAGFHPSHVTVNDTHLVESYGCREALALIAMLTGMLLTLMLRGARWNAPSALNVFFRLLGTVLRYPTRAKPPKCIFICDFQISTYLSLIFSYFAGNSLKIPQNQPLRRRKNGVESMKSLQVCSACISMT